MLFDDENIKSTFEEIILQIPFSLSIPTNPFQNASWLLRNTRSRKDCIQRRYQESVRKIQISIVSIEKTIFIDALNVCEYGFSSLYILDIESSHWNGIQIKIRTTKKLPQKGLKNYQKLMKSYQMVRLCNFFLQTKILFQCLYICLLPFYLFYVWSFLR